MSNGALACKPAAPELVGAVKIPYLARSSLSGSVMRSTITAERIQAVGVRPICGHPRTPGARAAPSLPLPKTQGCGGPRWRRPSHPAVHLGRAGRYTHPGPGEAPGGGRPFAPCSAPRPGPVATPYTQGCEGGEREGRPVAVRCAERDAGPPLTLSETCVRSGCFGRRPRAEPDAGSAVVDSAGGRSAEP